MLNIRKKLQPILWRLYRWYVSKPRWYTYDKMRIRVMSNVFHPRFLGSTQFLYSFIGSLEIRNKKVLELGAGSGIVALQCSRMGGQVTASDINPNAVESMKQSALNNRLQLRIIQSDVFDSIPFEKYDFILVNPPYYPKNPTSSLEQAFYCGSSFEFFHKLFGGIPEYTHPKTRILFVFSDTAPFDTIMKIAGKYGYYLKGKVKQNRWFEQFIIYELLQDKDGLEKKRL